MLQGEFPKDFPQDLSISAVWLEDKVGVKEYGWHYGDAIKVLEYCAKTSLIILGGDVLKITNGELEYTGDNWYFKNDDTRTKNEDVKASNIKARDYIKMYQAKIKGDYLYVLVY